MAILSSDVIFWHDFNNSTDSAGNYNLTVTNATFQSVTKLSANFTNALSFDGTGDYASMSSVTQLNGVAAYSFNWWVYMDEVTSQCFFCQDDIGTANEAIQSFLQNSGGPLRFAVSSVNNRGDLAIAGNVTTGAWYMLTLVYNGGATGNSNRLRFWINGVEKTLTYTGTIEATSGSGGTFYVGFRASGTSVYDFDGYYQQLLVTDTVITQTDIDDLYNSGSGITYGQYFASTTVKTWDGVARANVKTLLGVASANIKTINGIV